MTGTVYLTDEGEVFSDYKEYYSEYYSLGFGIQLWSQPSQSYSSINELTFNYSAIQSEYSSPDYPPYIRIYYCDLESVDHTYTVSAVSFSETQITVSFDPLFDFSNVDYVYGLLIDVYTMYSYFTLHSITTGDICADWTNLVNCIQRCT